MQRKIVVNPEGNLTEEIVDGLHLQQWRTLKSDYEGFLVLMRYHQDYFSLEQDAAIINRITGIPRIKEGHHYILLFNEIDLDNNLKKMIQERCCVLVCEEFPDEQKYFFS